jgi:hypothetical protein
MHPRTKPSAEDKFKLGTAVKSTGHGTYGPEVTQWFGLVLFLLGLSLTNNVQHPLRGVFMADSLSQKAVQYFQTPGKFVILLVCKKRQNILTEWGGKVIGLLLLRNKKIDTFYVYFITLTRKKPSF